MEIGYRQLKASQPTSLKPLDDFGVGGGGQRRGSLSLKAHHIISKYLPEDQTKPTYGPIEKAVQRAEGSGFLEKIIERWGRDEEVPERDPGLQDLVGLRPFLQLPVLADEVGQIWVHVVEDFGQAQVSALTWFRRKVWDVLLALRRALRAGCTRSAHPSVSWSLRIAMLHLSLPCFSTALVRYFRSMAVALYGLV